MRRGADVWTLEKRKLKFWLPDKAATAPVSLQYLRTKQPCPSASEGHLSVWLSLSTWAWEGLLHGVEQGCQRLGGPGWTDKFCTPSKVTRSHSCDSACLQQQQSWVWLASHKSLNFILHLFPQRAERKGNKYLLLSSLDPGFIPLTVLPQLL